jgi:hypothetical protein
VAAVHGVLCAVVIGGVGLTFKDKLVPLAPATSMASASAGAPKPVPVPLSVTEVVTAPRKDALEPRASIVVDSPAFDPDAIDGDELKRSVTSRKAALLKCFEKELKAGHARSGTLGLRFNISRVGRHSEFVVEENTLGTEAVAGCARTTMRAWVLPFKLQAETPVSFIFQFEAPPPVDPIH